MDDDFEIGLAQSSDIAVCAQLAERHGLGAADEWARTYRRTLDAADGARVMFVARRRRAVVGFARVRYLNSPLDEARALPSGWYLLGLLVAQSLRAQGLGRRLTVARLDWLAERADAGYFFTRPDNRASIRLHEQLGFRAQPGTYRLAVGGALTTQRLFRVELARTAALDHAAAARPPTPQRSTR